VLDLIRPGERPFACALFCALVARLHRQHPDHAGRHPSVALPGGRADPIREAGPPPDPTPGIPGRERRRAGTGGLNSRTVAAQTIARGIDAVR
jgi:hypothetical protein